MPTNEAIRIDEGQVRVHLWVCVTIVVATLALLFEPAAVAQLPLRCAMRTVFQVRCPFCGMTTDFISMLHGRMPSENPGSLLALVVIYLVYPAALVYTVFTDRMNVFQSPLVRRAALGCIAILWILNNCTR